MRFPLPDILYFDPITEQFQVMEQKMSIGRSNHLIFALEEFPTGVCSATEASWVTKDTSDKIDQHQSAEGCWIIYRAGQKSGP